MTQKRILSELNLVTPHTSHSESKRLTNTTGITPWYAVPWFLFIPALLSTLLLTEGEISRASYWQAQQNLFLMLNHLASFLPDALWINLTLLGDASILIPLLALLTLQNRRSWGGFLITIPIAGFTSIILKNLAHIPRPAEVLDPSGFHTLGHILDGHNSFPSGHSITVFAAVCALLPRLANRRHGPQYVSTIALVLVLATISSMSRIALGVHWPMDILFGAAFGAMSGILGTMLAARINWRGPTSLRSRTIAALILACLTISLIMRIGTDENSELLIWVAVFSGLVSSAILFLEDRYRIKIIVTAS